MWPQVLWTTPKTLLMTQTTIPLSYLLWIVVLKLYSSQCNARMKPDLRDHISKNQSTNNSEVECRILQKIITEPFTFYFIAVVTWWARSLSMKIVFLYLLKSNFFRLPDIKRQIKVSKNDQRDFGPISSKWSLTIWMKVIWNLSTLRLQLEVINSHLVFIWMKDNSRPCFGWFVAHSCSEQLLTKLTSPSDGLWMKTTQ